MPEGDTVWRTAHALHAALAGHALVRTDFRVPRLATVDLSGRTVLEVAPRGKHLLTRLEGGLTLHSHLGMEGTWRLAENPSPAPFRPAGKPGSPRAARTRPPLLGGSGPAHQIRVVLTTDGHTATGYRLPLLELVRTAEEFSVVGHLGPDLLGPDWDPAEAERRLLQDADRPLAEALLDQRNLAGIGNVYAAELCFLAHTSPWTPVGSLTQPLLSRLLTVAKRLLEANKDRTVRRTTNGHRADRNLAVYGREHRPCYRCGTPVRTGRYGPPERIRTIWYCPHCQPDPRNN
ncbi:MULTISPECIES: DNA-formamidopyrimidine glycosylase family protein [unclassified Streptomyces]|uniref:DNA-formamidopyrimidine glycosylase family protein n=1 Tax=unclassified Streptomyces TaxID=2593676 RepID=UPI002DDA5B96|nr:MULTISPECIES: DNA-formamidopyrimidine glycosylase family protein [unclassified Streptomyces]WSA92010.1 DNA glycosylase [Streptomyces sp. NBC_01795]WSB76377.1 DNA glycosylase [Streptomyces sp. NBC_01775]WSS44193.1 DNA glycosylase [Streptomyces sp. NBC_01187]